MFKKFVDGLPLGISIIALALGLGAFYMEGARESNRTLIVQGGSQDGGQVISIDAEEAARLLDNIRQTQRDADNAANAADAILGFIEGGFTLLGVLIAIATIVFGLSIQDVRSRLSQSIEEADERFDSTEKRLEDVLANINRQVADSIQQGEERVRASADRVTSLSHNFQHSIQETEKTIAGLHLIVEEAVQSAKTEAEKAFRVLSLLLLAEQQVRARNRTTAIATLNEAYEIDPNNQTTNYLLGYLYVGRKDFTKATDHLQRALNISPDFAPALAALGLAQRKMGDAIKDPAQTMQRNQFWSQAEYNLTKALNADSALIDADNESYFGSLGGLYRRQGRYEDATQAYESAVSTTPNNSYPVNNLATLYKKLGKEEQAAEMFARSREISEAILDDHPGDTWARLDLAQAFLVLGQKTEAKREYQNVINRLQESGPLETALSGLEFLADAPHPIAALDEMVALLQKAIQKLHS